MIFSLSLEMLDHTVDSGFVFLLTLLTYSGMSCFIFTFFKISLAWKTLLWSGHSGAIKHKTVFLKEHVSMPDRYFPTAPFQIA